MSVSVGRTESFLTSRLATTRTSGCTLLLLPQQQQPHRRLIPQQENGVLWSHIAHVLHSVPTTTLRRISHHSKQEKTYVSPQIKVSKVRMTGLYFLLYKYKGLAPWLHFPQCILPQSEDKLKFSRVDFLQVVVLLLKTSDRPSEINTLAFWDLCSSSEFLLLM